MSGGMEGDARDNQFHAMVFSSEDDDSRYDSYWDDMGDADMDAFGVDEGVASSEFRVESHGFSGGIWLLWNESVIVDISHVANQFIHGKVRAQLALLHPGDDEPWLTGGDFNALLEMTERVGGLVLHNGVSYSFLDFVSITGLLDLEFRGPPFTWSRGNLHQRLNRCLANLKWTSSFSHGFIQHLDKIGYDHVLSCCISRIIGVNHHLEHYGLLVHGRIIHNSPIF
ncbi:hypothetical protein V6N11_072884 [Hibiscus sabdariffa]|uniref:Uncharacterized protein n=2 Tax=Hibiscus sabdariffa TaxID=183260 RepID=A0ABR2AUV8_9ROSI